MKLFILAWVTRPVLVLFFPVLSIAQPPAQGPGLPGPNHSKELPLFGVLNIFQLTVQTVLDSANAKIKRDKDSTGVDAHLSFEYKAFPPYLTQTNYPDRPNEKVARMPLMLTYHVTGITWHGIPYAPREIGQSVDIYASCEGWATGSGMPTIHINGQQPFLDGNTTGEEVLNFFIARLLANYVDGAIGGQLAGFQNNSTIATLAPCNCIATSTPPGDTEANHYQHSVFDFGYNPPRRQAVIATSVSANNSETVSLVSVKRLPAHTNHSEILYTVEENPSLLLYVNQAVQVVHLGTMRENDIKTFSNIKFSFPKPAPAETVVVIATMQQSDNVLTTDSQFEVYDKTTNFGKGTKTVTVTKAYAQQPVHLPGGGNGGSNKPYTVHVGAYELTLNIDFPASVITQ